MEELKGIVYLRNKLASKTTRIEKRYRYYDMKYHVKDLGISTPDNLRHFDNVAGWCTKAVDALANRIVVREFKNDAMNFNDIFKKNKSEVLFDNAIISALISACSFIYISHGKDGAPRMQVIDGGNATGVIDDTTYLLKEGYAVLERDALGKPTLEAYFVPRKTYIYRKGVAEPEVYPHNVDYPLLVPIIYRPDAKRPFGRSAISRASMDYVDGAVRTLKRSEISAEFYSYPQKYIVGTDADAEPLDKWRASISSMIEITAGENGEKPTIGQFAQQSMEPHLAQLKSYASMFAGETDLTLDDLGFVTSNPTSDEAMKTAHTNLMLKARKAQRTFAIGFINAGYLCACLRDNQNYSIEAISDVKLKYEPIFVPDTTTLGQVGDALYKINQAVPNYIDEEIVRDLTGLERA